MTVDVEELARRVTRLEERFDKEPAPSPQIQPLWVIDGLRAKLEDTDDSGIVVLGGVWQQEEGALEWQFGRTVDYLLEQDWDDFASPLAALGHPVRLQLLKLVLSGTTTTRDLSQTEGLGTSGQLHHHLRTLVQAGWLRMRRRGDYEVPGPKVVPLLVILMSTTD